MRIESLDEAKENTKAKLESRKFSAERKKIFYENNILTEFEEDSISKILIDGIMSYEKDEIEEFTMTREEIFENQILEIPKVPKRTENKHFIMKNLPS